MVHEIEKLAAVPGVPSSSPSSATATASTSVTNKTDSGGAKDEETQKHELLSFQHSSATYSPPMTRRYR